MQSDLVRRIRKQRRVSILNEVAEHSARMARGNTALIRNAPDADNVQTWLAAAMRLDDPAGGGGSLEAPARTLVGPWDIGSAAAIRALRALPV